MEAAPLMGSVLLGIVLIKAVHLVSYLAFVEKIEVGFGNLIHVTPMADTVSVDR